MNTLGRLVIAAALGTAALAVQADPFYIDLNGLGGVGDPGGVGQKEDLTNCANCTSDVDELTLKYQSHTAITLSAAPIIIPNPLPDPPTVIPVITVGDVISTTGGYSVDGMAVNAITGLNPGGADMNFTSSPNGDADEWGITFDFSLLGKVASVVGGQLADVSYDSGTISLLLVEYLGGVISATNLMMDLIVTGSDLDNNSNLLIFGTLDFTSVNATYANMFNLQGGASCAGDITFDGIAACVPSMDFTFVLDQNLNDPVFEAYDFNANVLTVGGNHDGSLAFAVPEPGTLLLLGSALLGLAGARRLRKAS